MRRDFESNVYSSQCRISNRSREDVSFLFEVTPKFPGGKVCVDLLVDNSLSMGLGEPGSTRLDKVKEAMVRMTEQLKDHPRARVHIRTFGRRTVDMFPFTGQGYEQITSANISCIQDRILGIEANEPRTNIEKPMMESVMSLRREPGRIDGGGGMDVDQTTQGYIVLLTDGAANEGIFDARHLVKKMSNPPLPMEYNVGVMSVGSGPEADFVKELSLGGHFTLALDPQSIGESYEMLCSGIDDVMRRVRLTLVDSMGNATSHTKLCSSPADVPVVLGFDLSVADLVAFGRREGDNNYKLCFQVDGDQGVYHTKEICVTVVDGPVLPEPVPEIIEADRRLRRMGQAYQQAILQIESEPEVAIGRLVAIANNVVQPSDHGTVRMRSLGMQDMVARTAERARSHQRETPRIRVPHSRNQHDPFSVMDTEDPSTGIFRPLGDHPPTYRSFMGGAPLLSGYVEPPRQPVPSPVTSNQTNLISLEAMNQVSKYC